MLRIDVLRKVLKCAGRAKLIQARQLFNTEKTQVYRDFFPIGARDRTFERLRLWLLDIEIAACPRDNESGRRNAISPEWRPRDSS